jgi:hypothetical protein
MKRALLVLLLAGCDPVDVVVANVPDGGEMPPMHPCADNSDCHPNEYCDKPTCGDVHGDCRLKPNCMTNDYTPVCGCNGVTYWNDCFRKADGSSAVFEAQECSAAKTCVDASECSPSPYAACARVSSLSCPASGSTGACWVMPAVCPSGQSTTWQECSGGACLDYCGAIKSEQPALLKPSCP